MALTITVTDQTTIGLIRLYRQYVREQDQIEGTVRDLAEGLVITFLDEHHRFREWRKANAMNTHAG